MVNTPDIAKLVRNPFSLVPEERVTVWAGYKGVQEALFDIVESCRSDQVGLSEFVIIHGDYGTGKSHALRYLRYWITENRKDEFDSPVVYLHSIKVAATMSFVALYKKIMEDLMGHIRETADWLDLVVEDFVRKGNPDARRQELDTEINAAYRTLNISPSFPALSLLLKGIKDGSSDAMGLLLGEKLGRGRGTYLAYDMTGPIESEYDAVSCLGAYVNLCSRGVQGLDDGNILARNKAFYFFFDEVETLQDFRPQEALSINQGLRDLINACPENCCFLLGISGDTRTIFALLTQPVMRRLSRDPIDIQPMSPEEAVSFLKEVLRGYRSNPDDPDEYPFREAALLRIAESTQNRTPADLFRGCRRVLERAVLTERLQPDGWIEESDVEELL